MNVTVFPGPLQGRVQAPPSKSACHRLLLGAGLARGTSVIGNVSYSQDILATLDVLEALGAKIEKEEELLKVYIQDNSLFVQIGNTSIASRLIEGEFVKYNHILPNSFEKLLRNPGHFFPPAQSFLFLRLLLRFGFSFEFTHYSKH